MIHAVIGNIREAFDLAHWAQWFQELDRTFVFLLVLPFVVAIVGLWSAWRDRDVAGVNEFPERAGRSDVTTANSSWRPRSVNDATANAAAGSKHLIGRARGE